MEGGAGATDPQATQGADQPLVEEQREGLVAADTESLAQLLLPSPQLGH